MKKIKYTKPEIIDIAWNVSQGACNHGSNDTDGCNTGSDASKGGLGGTACSDGTTATSDAFAGIACNLGVYASATGFWGRSCRTGSLPE